MFNPKGRIVLPTCISKGASYVICEICGEEELLEEHPIDTVNGHNWEFIKVIKSPTCTEEGISQYKCSLCGSVENHKVPSYGRPHDFMDVYSYDNEEHWQECSICGTKTSVEPHFLSEKRQTVAPGCTTTGEYQQTCLICGAVIKTEIPAKGHRYDLSTWDFDTAYHYHKCLDCDMTTVKILHTFEEYRIEPTCTEYGEYGDRCTECEGFYKKGDLEPLGHDWNEPTYEWKKTESGYQCTAKRVCKRNSKHIESEVVNAMKNSQSGALSIMHRC